MDATARELSIAIEEVSKALAEWTLAAHIEQDPTLLVRFGAESRGAMVRDIQQRVLDLAQAVAVRRPEAFALSATWMAVAYSVREIGVDDLARSLACLRDVFRSMMPAEVVTAVLPCIDAALAAVHTAPAPPAIALDPADPIDRRVLEYLQAMLENRRRDAEAIALAGLDAGLGWLDVYVKVLEPALREVGRLWHYGDISVADEHAITAATESIMALLRSRAPVASPNGRTVVATAVSGELHEVGIRMVGDFLESAGWNVVLLGASMPALDVVQSLAHQGADLLAISASGIGGLRAIGDVIDLVRRSEATGNVRILVGGRPFVEIPGLWQELGADGCATSAAAAVEVANELVAKSGA